jgi:hypothetical protein
MPVFTVPGIWEALSSDTGGLKYLAGILLAASGAVSTKIDAGIREFIVAIDG